MTRPKLYIATPSRDFAVTAHAAQSVIHLLNDPARDFDVAYDPRQYDEDVVVVRARYVRQFLETDATHLLFVDADVAFAPVAVHGMLAASQLGHGFVLTPYRKKRIEWGAIAGEVNKRMAFDDETPITALELQVWGESYPLILAPEGTPYDEASRTFPIASFGLGLSLLTRETLEGMVAHFRDELEQDDLVEGKWRPTVSLFRHVTTRRVQHDGAERRPFTSEDSSFCERYFKWRRLVDEDAGIDPHVSIADQTSKARPRMYVGEGSPAVHAGPFLYVGHVEAFSKR